MHGDLRRVADLFPDEIKTELLKTVAEESFPIFDFQYRLSRCADCAAVVSVPVLELEERSYQGKCGRCGKKTELIEDISTESCPVCQTHALEREQTGLWD